jgi:hypothetical protein
MINDRRNKWRAELGRRGSDRLMDYRMVRWRADRDPTSRCGWVVEWSSNGLAMVTERVDTPATGSRLVPNRRSRGPGFVRAIVVQRVSSLSPVLDLVAGVYISTQSGRRTCLHPDGPARDRRHAPRQKVDRRRSSRWSVTKPIQWRVLRGRRVRSSEVLERSLDGLVMRVDPQDAPRIGTRFVTTGHGMAETLGFHSAIVRRTEAPNDDYRLLFAEIEA